MEKCSEQNNCHLQNCRQTCAQEVIDALLRANGSVRGEEVDLLLDLRWLVRHQHDPEQVLKLFCELRRRLEEEHYLLFYRLRRWLENHLQAVVVHPERAAKTAMPLKLDFYCLEAVRGGCVRAARQQGMSLSNVKVEFAFRSHAPVLATDMQKVGEFGAPGRT